MVARVEPLPNGSRSVLYRQWTANDSPRSCRPRQLGPGLVLPPTTPPCASERQMPLLRRSSTGRMSTYRFKTGTNSRFLCDVAANTRLDSLHHLARNKASLRVECRTCDRVRLFDAERFARYCMLRGWNTQLASLSARLVCQQCGARHVRLSASPERPGPDPFPATEAGWRQLFRRLRD